MLFFYIPQAIFFSNMQKHRKISSNWNSSVRAVHSVHLLCMKRNTQVKRSLLTSSHTLPLLWFISAVAECATLSSVSTQLKYRNCTHGLRERGKSASSDCAHVQYILEELLLLQNASLSSSGGCHVHILVGDSCFMPPPPAPLIYVQTGM